MRQEIIDSILAKKIIVIVRGMPAEDILPTAQAMCEAGIKQMEFTLNQSDPVERLDTARTIALLREKLGDRMYFGAGTVMNVQQLDLVESAGAQFIISPHTNTSVIEKTVAHGMVSIPGAFSPTEIQTAHEAGADFVKVFPVNVLGPAYVKAVLAPLNNIRLLAVGNMDITTMEPFWNAGCVGWGMGGKIIDREAIAKRDFARVAAVAKEYTALADSLTR